MNRFTYLKEEYDLLSYRQRVSGFILKDGKFVVGQFNKGTDGKPYFGNGGGGVDKEDNTEEDALVREIREELGVDVEIIKKLCTKMADYAEYYGGQSKIPDTIDRTYGKDGFKTIFFLCKYKGINKSLHGTEPDTAKAKVMRIEDYYTYIKDRMEKCKEEKSWLYFLLKQEIEVMEEYLLK